MEYKTLCTKMVKTIEDSNGIQDPVYFLGKKQLTTRLEKLDDPLSFCGKNIIVNPLSSVTDSPCLHPEQMKNE